MIPAFFTDQPTWMGKVGQIYALLERVKITEERAGDLVRLRRANRISSVHSSTAIEGNQLTLEQVSAVADGQPVYAPARDVLEVSNALAAYEVLGSLDPYSVDDFLRAHGMLTRGLVDESGAFRTVEVAIVNVDDEVLHTGSRPAKVPRLVAELFEWASAADQHPLVVSSATHYLIEHIHPFRDGNGRIGRLWQTLMLSRWNPVFEWMPTESLIRRHQGGYYQALQDSHDPDVDAAPFITFMLDIIELSLRHYGDPDDITDTPVDGVSVGVSDGVTDGEGQPVRLDPLDRTILARLTADPTLTITLLAGVTGKSSRTIERRMAKLTSACLVHREGSDKTGVWVVSQTAW
ncbi:MAG: Fic family protein [Micrococcales bacterium]|nr:Fic family protein [Micrococcales bacterium]